MTDAERSLVDERIREFCEAHGIAYFEDKSAYDYRRCAHKSKCLVTLMAGGMSDGPHGGIYCPLFEEEVDE